MNIKLYIGTELADFNEVFNVMFSIGDIRELSFGNSNNTYTLNLPLTKTNKKLISYINQADVKTETSAIGRMYLNDMLVIQGDIKILGYSSSGLFARIIISADDWITDLSSKKMTELDLSASDHSLTQAVVEASWTASYPVYRYPMIDFGGLQSSEYGTTAKWYPTDFIPMVSVASLVAKILEPYTISSAWIATTYVKDLFILCKEILVDSAFILNKALSVSVTNVTDNNTTNSGSGYMNVTLSKVLSFSTETSDEAAKWVTNKYTIPATGTYRFVATINLRNTAYGNGNLTITDESVNISILKDGAPLDNIATAAYVATELLDGVSYVLDSKYCHCLINEVITVIISCHCEVTVTTGTQSVSIGTLTTSTFVNMWGNANRYSGLNKTISLEEMLPDMTQLEFLSAIRDISNLRFWSDRNRQINHIEPWDSFLSSTVVDLTDYIDYSSIDAELISESYFKNILLKWKDDTSDKAYEDYLTFSDSPGQKLITLNSIYAKPGIETREHQLSSIVTGYNKSIHQYTVPVPQIFNVAPEYPYTTFNRKVDFNTRIVEWKGLTSGFTWYHLASTKTTYPKIQGLDFGDLYTSYWKKLLHYIDQGKLYTIRMKINTLLLGQFFTVINTAADEGFRPTYKFPIDGIDNYFFLQKITTDGDMAECEFVLKQ